MMQDDNTTRDDVPQDPGAPDSVGELRQAAVVRLAEALGAMPGGGRLSFSRLARLAESVDSYLWEYSHPTETDAMTLGRAVHNQVLQGLLEDEYARAPAVDRRTKAGKAAMAEHLAQCSSTSKTSLDADKWALVETIDAQVQAHPEAWPLIEAGRALGGHGITCRSELLALEPMAAAELPVEWYDAYHHGGPREAGYSGVALTARLDGVAVGDHLRRRAEGVRESRDGLYVYELKTARSAAREAWRRTVAQRLYHMQASLYLQGLQIWLDVDVPWWDIDYYWIVCETVAPYHVAVYQPGRDLLQQAVQIYQLTIAQARAWLEAGAWPGLPIDQDALPAAAPWAHQAILDRFQLPSRSGGDS
jgi:hypothetical protein